VVHHAATESTILPPNCYCGCVCLLHPRHAAQDRIYFTTNRGKVKRYDFHVKGQDTLIINKLVVTPTEGRPPLDVSFNAIVTANDPSQLTCVLHAATNWLR